MLRSIEQLAARHGLVEVVQSLDDVIGAYHPSHGTVVYFCDGVYLYRNLGDFKKRLANSLAQARRQGLLRNQLLEMAFALAAFDITDRKTYFHRNIGAPRERHYNTPDYGQIKKDH
ncbi:MAG: hypothetical protein D6790_15055 [Caldilineae bacterium]|nr:MAG: hypothetical protein D6790_15055 [Caldilineae bacterium]